MKTLRLLNFLLVAVLTATLLLSCGDKEETVTKRTEADSLINIAHKNHGAKFHALLDKLSGGMEDKYDKELKSWNGRILPEVES